MKNRGAQRGNVFTILLGGIVLSGMLAIALYQLMGGPVFSTVKLAKQTAGEAQAQTVARMIIANAVNTQPVNATTGIAGDCDSDGSVEPPAWRAAAGWTASQPTIHPTNGGLVPLTIGAPVTDPWGTEYGYCVWDVGAANDPTTGGTDLTNCPAGAKRLSGSPNPTTDNANLTTVIALISAGPDKTFDTTCYNYSASLNDATHSTTDLVQTTTGKDDVVARYTYTEAAQATSSLWALKSGAPTIATITKDLSVGSPSTNMGAISAAPAPLAPSTTSVALTTSGKIVAGGAMKLGTDANVTNCGDAGHAGLMRYCASNSGSCASSQYKVQFCNGATNSWTSISSGSGGGGSIKGIKDLLVQPANTVPDGYSSYASQYFLGIGQNTLGSVTGTLGYNTPGKPQQSAKLQAGNNTATVSPTAPVAGQQYVMDGGGGRMVAPSAGDTIIVEVSATNATGSSSISVTDSTTNVVAGSTTHTYATAQEVKSCATTRGTAGIYYYTYATAPGNTTITVRPVTNASSITWSVTEYSNISGTNTPATDVDLKGQATSTATAGATVTVPSSSLGTTALPNELALAVLTDCSLAGTVDTLGTNQAGSNPNTWTPDYSETSIPNALPKYADSGAVHQILSGTVANAAHTWTVRGGATAPKGYAGAIATFKPSTNNLGPVYETAAGYGALQHATSGAYNTAVGYNALTALTTSTYNAALGASALSTPTTGSVNNLAIGANALAGNTTGTYNVAIGTSALGAATQIGGYNTAIGYQSLLASNVATDTNNNETALGYQALVQKNATTSDVGIGYQALAGVSTTNRNFGIGYKAGAANTASNFTGAFGYKAAAVDADSGSSAFGALAAANIPSGEISGAFGYNAMGGTGGPGALAFGANTFDGVSASAGHHTAFGYYALHAATSGSSDTAFGYNTLAAVTSGSNNTATGNSALAANVTGSNNTAFGHAAASGGTAPNGITAFGSQTLVSDNALGETGVGYKALNANNGFTTSATGAATSGGLINLTVTSSTGFTTGNVIDVDGCVTASNANGTWTATVVDGTHITLQGSVWSGTACTTGTVTLNGGNTAFGYSALAAATAARNTAFGASALASDTIGNDNTAFGYQALFSNTGGNYNTAAGYQALANNATGYTSPTIAVRQVTTLGSLTNPPATTTISFPTPPLAGSTIIVFVTDVPAMPDCYGLMLPAANVTDNQGGTSGSYLMAYGDGGGCSGFTVSIFYRPVISAPGGGPFTITLTQTAGTNGIQPDITYSAMEVTGLSGALDQVTENGWGLVGPTPLTIATPSTSQPNELAVTVATGGDWPPLTYNFVPSGGWTTDQLQNTQNGGSGGSRWPVIVAHRLINSAGPVSVTFPVVSGGSALGAVATFKGTSTNFGTPNGDYGERNTAVGYQALFSNLSGDDNTAVGDNALSANTTGSDNTALGYQALMSNSTGIQNTAIGYQALMGTGVTGTGNTAAGYQALYSNSTGNYNSAYGYRALYANTTGNNNTAYGANALLSSISDSGSTAFGYNALTLSNIGNTTTGNTAVGESALATLVSDTGNTAVGYQALKVAATGSTATTNTALGYQALVKVTTGVNNTAIGASAGAIITTGSNNTAVGYLAGPTATHGTISNTTAIGYNAAVTASNTIRFGDTNIANSGSPPYGVSGQVAWSNPSDRRLKKDIADSDLGLDFILKLRPVSYRLIHDLHKRFTYGFIAQEIEKALGDRITNMITQENNAMKSYLLRAADLLAPIVKAIQQQETIEEKQRAQIDALHARLEKVKAEMKELKKESAP